MGDLSKQKSVVQQLGRLPKEQGPVVIPGGIADDAESRIIGMHVFGNLYDLDPKVINDKELLTKTVLDAIKIANMTLVEHRSWGFGGKKGGISVMALITESHVVLHTWNEYRYATLDIYTCGTTSNPNAAFDHIVSVLKPKRHKKYFADRSSN